MLLLLDGVEPLQDAGGTLRDLPLKALLQELGTGHRGLAACTTRVAMDLPEAKMIDLDNLTPEEGAKYLRSLEVKGAEEELQKASLEYGNHALALTLLGKYLVDFCGRDVLRRFEIRGLTGEEGTLPWPSYSPILSTVTVGDNGPTSERLLVSGWLGGGMDGFDSGIRTVKEGSLHGDR